MQNRQGSYEKIILTIAALAAIGTAAYLVLESQGFEESIQIGDAAARKELNAPNTAEVGDAIDTIKKKYSWLSPKRNGKPVPLNKSVLLVMKDAELFDLLLPEPQLRPPMTNAYLIGDKSKMPPEPPLPGIFSPNVGALDADADGFTNLEEFEAKTNPRDASSMPPLTSKLFLRQRISHDYILKLVGGSGGTFQIQRTVPTKVSVFKPLNEEFGFDKGTLRFKILSSRQDTIQHPTLGPMQAHILKIYDMSTKKEFELVQGKELNLAEYEAEFEFRWKKRITIPGVKEGKTFQLPGLGVTYHVIKLEETQAEIAPDDKGKPSKEVITVKQG